MNMLLIDICSSAQQECSHAQTVLCMLCRDSDLFTSALTCQAHSVALQGCGALQKVAWCRGALLGRLTYPPMSDLQGRQPVPAQAVHQRSGLHIAMAAYTLCPVQLPLAGALQWLQVLADQLGVAQADWSRHQTMSLLLPCRVVSSFRCNETTATSHNLSTAELPCCWCCAGVSASSGAG